MEQAFFGRKTISNPTSDDYKKKQTKQSIKKLSTKQDLQNKYEETPQKDLQNGYVVKVDPATDKEPACSYLPQMHPVFFKVNHWIQTFWRDLICWVILWESS